MRKLLLLASLLLTTPASADIVYNLNVSAGALTATGTVTTDGFIGVFPNTVFLQPTHIRSFSINISDGIFSDNINSDFHRIGGIQGFALIATPTELQWNFNAPNSLFDAFTGMAMTEIIFGPGSLALQ